MSYCLDNTKSIAVFKATVLFDWVVEAVLSEASYIAVVDEGTTVMTSSPVGEPVTDIPNV